MITVAIIGAGSVVFTQEIVSDLLQHPATRDVHFRLMDQNPVRLAQAQRLVRRMAEAAQGHGAVVATSELEVAMQGADYVINTVLVGGRSAVQKDFTIAARYGVRHTVGDTLGVSGIMRGVRTIPVVIHIAQQMERIAPQAILLNYTNPMSMLIMAVSRTSAIQHFGLCHSTVNTAQQVAEYLEVSPKSLQWQAAGINHMAWMLTLSVEGQNMYPELLRRSRLQPWFNRDPVRFDLLQRTGYFVTESSKHSAEYYAAYAHWPAEVARLGIPLDEYLTRKHRDMAAYLSDQEQRPSSELLFEASGEYAPRLIQARTTGETWWFQANVMNHGLIDNLPKGACVEVPCLVYQHGIVPTIARPLPLHLAALNRQAISVQELTVDAVIQGSRDRLYQAVMMDPQASAAMTLDAMRVMVDELLEAQGALVPNLERTRLWPTTSMCITDSELDEEEK